MHNLSKAATLQTSTGVKLTNLLLSVRTHLLVLFWSKIHNYTQALVQRDTPSLSCK